MSKIQANQKFRLVAKMLKDIDQAEEVFINCRVLNQEHNQMIQEPLVLFNSSTNTIAIQSVAEGYGDFQIDLNGELDLQIDRGSDSFTYWIEFNKNYEITITNEW